MSEDSLYLNITAPKDAENLPVMVWFHGGAFAILSANSQQYNNPDGLTEKGVVLVTVNHRLGPFGYIAHPLLTAESGYGGSGNYGSGCVTTLRPSGVIRAMSRCSANPAAVVKPIH